MDKKHEDYLGELRKQINGLDYQLINIISQRTNIVQEVGDYKKTHNLEVYQPGREKELYAARRGLAEDASLNPDMIEGLFKLIVEESKRPRSG